MADPKSLKSQIGQTGGWFDCDLLIDGDRVDGLIGSATVHFDFVGVEAQLESIELALVGQPKFKANIDALPFAWRAKFEADLALIAYPSDELVAA